MPAEREAVRYLAGLGEARRHFGLERISLLCAGLGHPEASLPAVFHVAGTNGKGSTAALLAAALQATGRRVGLYTSPHLVSLCERIRIDGVEVSPAVLAEHVATVRALAEGVPADDRPTFFEVVTACAFRHFAREGVDAAVLEVGLGGRLDATNVVTPLVAVLTRLAVDHTRWLGTDLADIAREKAGIVKAGRPVVSTWDQPAARRVLDARCQELGAPLSVAGEDFTVRASGGAAGRAIDFRGRRWTLEDVALPLPGVHQRENAGLALAALEAADASGWPVDRARARRGLVRAEWPGRLEVVAHGPQVVLDGAHNEDAARALAASVPGLFPAAPRILLLGVSADKDHDRLLAALAPLARTAVVTSFGGPRGLAVEDLLSVARAHFAEVVAEAVPGRALDRARALAAPDGLVLATGSLFLVGRLRDELLGGTGAFRFS